MTTTSQVHSRFSNDRMRSFVELSAPNRPVGSICGASNGPSQDPYGSVWPWQKNYKTDFCHFKKDTVSFGPCFFFRVALENLSFLLTIHACPVRKIDKTVAGLQKNRSPSLDPWSFAPFPFGNFFFPDRSFAPSGENIQNSSEPFKKRIDFFRSMTFLTEHHRVPFFGSSPISPVLWKEYTNWFRALNQNASVSLDPGIML